MKGWKCRRGVKRKDIRMLQLELDEVWFGGWRWMLEMVEVLWTSSRFRRNSLYKLSYKARPESPQSVVTGILRNRGIAIHPKTPRKLLETNFQLTTSTSQLWRIRFQRLTTKIQGRLLTISDSQNFLCFFRYDVKLGMFSNGNYSSGPKDNGLCIRTWKFE